MYPATLDDSQRCSLIEFVLIKIFSGTKYSCIYYITFNASPQLQRNDVYADELEVEG